MVKPSFPTQIIFILALLLAHTAWSQAFSNETKNKCSAALWHKKDSLPVSVRQGEMLRVSLVVKDIMLFQQWAQDNGVFIIHTYTPAGVVVIEDRAQHFWDTTLRRSEVVFAELWRPQAQLELPVPGHNIYANNIAYVHNRFPEITGAVSVISIKEFGFDTTDVDIKSRYIPNVQASTFTTSHALLMATLAGGGGVSALASQGVAPGSQLVSSSFFGLLPNIDADYDRLDIKVQNHSYGLDIENYYGVGALAYDANTWNHPQLLHVFSAGNYGLDTSTEGPYAQVSAYANLSGSFKMAKNILLAGSVDSFNRVVAISSKGPAYDGRIKPDLTAYGPDGTSSAAALVSGAAAIARHAFYQKYNYAPNSDMVRAILLGATQDSGSPGPDYAGGFGQLNLKKVVELIHSGFAASDSLSDGEYRVFSITVPEYTEKLTATLCWNDVPAQPNAAKALVNDLDLILESPDGHTYLPWVLHTNPQADSLALPAERRRDSLNNTEQISIMLPEAGIYQLKVSAYHIPEGLQSFALVCRQDTLGHFAWTFPLSKAPLFAGGETVLRWENSQDLTNGRLEWQITGSNNWHLIDPETPLAPAYFQWNIPDTFAAAQMKMVINSHEYLSDTFLITPELKVKIGFNCQDSLMLSWSNIHQNAKYRLWGLGDSYMEPLLVTGDTTIVLQKSQYPQVRFAVSAIHPEHFAEGARSSAPDIRTQGVYCYINNLLAFLNDNQIVDLQLFIGSDYGVKDIFIEKWNTSQWSPIAVFQPGALKYLTTDFQPNTGVNRYRARLEMQNGGSLTGDTVVVYYAGEKGHLVFPNPVRAGADLTIVSTVTDEAPVFKLYNTAGQLLIRQLLEDVNVAVRLRDMPPGCYFWETTGDSSGRRLGAGKLVVY